MSNQFDDKFKGMMWGVVQVISETEWAFFEQTLSDSGVTCIEVAEILLGFSWETLRKAGCRLVRLDVIDGLPCNYVSAWEGDLPFRVEGIQTDDQLLPSKTSEDIAAPPLCRWK